MIEYRIRPLRPEAHLFEVSLTVANPTPEGQAFSLPAWIPGSYMIRDFARHLVHIEADSHGQTLPIAKIDKQTWQVPPCEGPVHIQYQVYAWDLSVRGAHLDTTHGYFNGTCVFLAPMGHEDLPCEVEVEAPDGRRFEDWRVATGLQRLSGSDLAFGRFRADNYDALIDHPVEMGPFDYAQFEACGVPHWVILSGRHHTDMARLCRDLKPICEHHIRMFGQPAPMDRYMFMTLVTGNGYGGLEHRNSTSLMCARDDLPKRTDDPLKVRDGYRNYLGLCSHEYFHTWNVKRIKPAAFTPFDLSQEVHTELLWAFEGITSYYDDLSLARTGLISSQSYLELLGQTLTRVYRGQGRHKQTVTESSFDAWTRFYKQDENAPNAIVSYYTKGSLVALALDLTLRNVTDEKQSLDDLMRLLWERYGQTGEGVPEQGIQPLAEEVAGCDLSAFFEQALYSTEDLPLDELLAERGVELNWRSAAGHADNGGKPGKEGIPHLGVRVTADPLGAKIAVAFEQGAAMSAGLSAGDVIIAVDSLQATAANLDNLLASFLPGETVELHAFRRDELMTFKVKVGPGEPSTAYLTIAKGGLTEKGKAWLHAKSNE
ncbi:M61 family metallopeptidase [Alcanivorax sp. DP30]|uniref:M61 family metallopeptidase n=1 Tax=Alcanivorax sp. DP30 TaxID=2606217 RepID=UPI00137127CF|nr:PDZ domain-containing protein [Alcanivorax sp. DP30]MZR61555.1 PDZ domain-containing protein [Alcanivorax sp. DP30]